MRLTAIVGEKERMDKYKQGNSRVEDEESEIGDVLPLKGCELTVREGTLTHWRSFL